MPVFNRAFRRANVCWGYPSRPGDGFHASPTRSLAPGERQEPVLEVTVTLPQAGAARAPRAFKFISAGQVVTVTVARQIACAAGKRVVKYVAAL